MISVIMPAFNSEKTIKESINSVIKQTYEDWELIIVNDGSTDSTETICKEEENKDKRIKLINKNNEGVSVARNTAIKEAKGEYVCFLDSDDFMNENMLKEMLKKIQENNVEVVKCNNNFEYKFLQEKKYEKREINEYILPLLLQERVNGYIWTLMIRKEKIPLFNENISIYEDLDFYIKLFNNIQSFFFYNKNLYQYNNTENSLTKRNPIHNIKEMIKADEQIKIDLNENNNYNDKYIKMIDTRVITNINNYIYLLTLEKKHQDTKEMINVLRKMEIVKNYDSKYTTLKERIFNYSILHEKNFLFLVLCSIKNYIKK